MDTIPASEMSNPEVSPRATSQARRHSFRIMAVLASLMALNSISTDMYLPAMPQMARDLGARGGELEYTISGYLVGFSLGQLLWGAVSDRFGRRIPIAIGIVLFNVGSAGCALSGTATAVIGWRVVQAVGACAGVVLARAMVRDLFERERAAQKLSTLITIMAVAPLVGSQVLTFASWPWTFWLMVVIGAGLLVALFFAAGLDAECPGFHGAGGGPVSAGAHCRVEPGQRQVALVVWSGEPLGRHTADPLAARDVDLVGTGHGRRAGSGAGRGVLLKHRRSPDGPAGSLSLSTSTRHGDSRNPLPLIRCAAGKRSAPDLMRIQAQSLEWQTGQGVAFASGRFASGPDP